MKYRKVQFTIKPNGEILEEVISSSEPDCKEITAGFEDALGDVKSRRDKRLHEAFNYFSSSINDVLNLNE